MIGHRGTSNEAMHPIKVQVRVSTPKDACLPLELEFRSIYCHQLLLISHAFKSIFCCLNIKRLGFVRI